MTNKETINLIDWRAHCNNPRYNKEKDHFKIESMKNTIAYRAGSFISETIVHDLISVLKWNVNIRQPKESDFN